MLTRIGITAMSLIVRFAGFLLAALTIATVAIAQGGGQPAPRLHPDREAFGAEGAQPRLTRPVQLKRGDLACAPQACIEPPQRDPSIAFDAQCRAGQFLLVQRADGRSVRYLCRRV